MLVKLYSLICLTNARILYSNNKTDIVAMILINIVCVSYGLPVIIIFDAKQKISILV